MKNNLIIFSALFLGSMAANAAGTGAQFLKIDTDARASAMASAGTASVPGVNALNYNPAGLMDTTGPEISFSHTKWLMDANHDFIGFGLPVKGMAFGLGITRLSNGTMAGRGEDGASTCGYSAYDQAISVGMGFGAFGGAIKYIQSNIAGVRAEAFAVDLGVKRKLTGFPVSLGFSVQNLGGGLKYMSQRDELPLSVNAGLSLHALPGVGLVLDAKRLVHDRETVFSVGTEYALFSGGDMGFALRGGYGLAGVPREDKSGVSLGAGIMAFGANLDYAVSPEAGLGSVQRITLVKKF